MLIADIGRRYGYCFMFVLKGGDRLCCVGDFGGFGCSRGNL